MLVGIGLPFPSTRPKQTASAVPNATSGPVDETAAALDLSSSDLAAESSAAVNNDAHYPAALLDEEESGQDDLAAPCDLPVHATHFSHEERLLLEQQTRLAGGEGV